MSDDDDRSLGRSLLMGIGALVVASLVIGGIIGVVTLGAVQFTGVTDERGPAAEPSLYIPKPSPTPSPSESAGDEATGQQRNADQQQDKKQQKQQNNNNKKNKNKKKNNKKQQARKISLSASPLSVSEMQRIDLTGTYPRSEGASLQVQRFESGWTDFPVTATVRGGTFSTYVMTGRTGTNRFRVVDTGSGKASNPVRVQVG